MTLLTMVRESFYQDSVVLLDLARRLRSSPGVLEAAALMATPANKALLARSDLLSAEAQAAGPHDLVIALSADTQASAEHARRQAEAFFETRARRVEPGGRLAPRTIESARRQLPGANLVLISVPGAFAAAEARKALNQGLHVMIFSDNVTLEDEIVLKRLAHAKDRLLMGPDCGSAYLGGVPLGFANAVPRGRIGLVAASGTGLQQVATLLAARGEGLSHGIGVGGRDMSERVGGMMTLAALDALAADPATEVVVVVGKPPAPAVRAAVEARLRSLGRPCVMGVLGAGVRIGREGPLIRVATLEDAAMSASAVARGEAWSPRAFSQQAPEIRRRVGIARAGLPAAARAIRGLYAGGTLAHEAALILERLLGPISGNLTHRSGATHGVFDLGADEFTTGRAHPMLDPGLRIEEIAKAARDASVGILILDVVLGHGASRDPAGDIAPAIEAARATAWTRGRTLAVVATVVGTPQDPQGLVTQTARLESAGAWVLPSNAQAARAAACIAGDEAVMEALLGEDAV